MSHESIEYEKWIQRLDEEWRAWNRSKGEPPFDVRPGAIPLTDARAQQALRNLRSRDLPALLAAYRPQSTNAACSLASVTMAMNVLARPEKLFTEDDILSRAQQPEWVAQTRHEGSGVTFKELQERVKASLVGLGLDKSLQVESHPIAGLDKLDGDVKAFAAALNRLAEPNAALLIYFNQGVVAGDWDGMHVAPVAGRDPETGLVLVMEVDWDLSIPYFVTLDKLVEAMGTQAGRKENKPTGSTGGFVLIHT